MQHAACSLHDSSDRAIYDAYIPSSPRRSLVRSARLQVPVAEPRWLCVGRCRRLALRVLSSPLRPCLPGREGTDPGRSRVVPVLRLPTDARSRVETDLTWAGGAGPAAAAVSVEPRAVRVVFADPAVTRADRAGLIAGGETRLDREQARRRLEVVELGTAGRRVRPCLLRHPDRSWFDAGARADLQ